MDIQRAATTVQREKGVYVTARVDGKLMLHLLRSEYHKLPLVEELPLRDATGAYVATR
jgi:hypothetical protein